jgi:hypothetical protein
MGWFPTASTGNFNCPSIMWAQNLLGKKTIAGTLGAAPAALKEFEYVSSCAFALLWNMVKSRVPEEVLIDVKNLMSSDNTPFKMDQGLKYWGMELPVKVRGKELSAKELSAKASEGVEKEFYEFQGADLAPPQGAFGTNYARFCHKEKNAHRWCYAWTTERNLPPDRGGNFYVTSFRDAASPGSCRASFNPTSAMIASLPEIGIQHQVHNCRSLSLPRRRSDRRRGRWCSV